MSDLINFPEQQPELPAITEAPRPKRAKTTEEKFYPSLIVKDKGGDEFPVPTDAGANALANQLLASKMRAHYARMLKDIEDNKLILEPKSLKELYQCGLIVAEISDKAFANNSSTDAALKEGNSALSVAGEMVRNAFDGLTTAQLREKRLHDIGKRKDEKKVESCHDDILKT
jgi:hypothetical protein